MAVPMILSPICLCMVGDRCCSVYLLVVLMLWLIDVDQNKFVFQWDTEFFEDTVKRQY